MSLEGWWIMNFLHCLLHFRVQGNCSLGPLLAECTWSSVKNTVQILAFRAMNLSGKENESWLLLFRLPLFHKTCPGFLSGANTWILQTLQLWHKHFTCSLECLHTDKCWSSFISHPHGPQGTRVLTITCSALLGAWSLQMFLHRNSIPLVSKSSPHRPCRDSFLSLHWSLFTVTGFVFHGLLSSPTI